MKRRTLDLLFSIGGLGLAVLLLVVGIVLTTNANFANSYVHDQLAAQHISFTPADKLSDEDRLQLQQYVTQCYGSLTTFNVLFKDKADYFIGQASKDD